MKSLIAMAALSGAVILSATTFTPTAAAAQAKAECKQHLTGADRISGPARDAMIKRYRDCLARAKK